MRSFRVFALTVSAAFVLSLGIAVHAATISAGTSVTVPANGVAPGSATNYDFFGGPQPVLLTDYSVSIAGDSQYDGHPNVALLYTTVTAPDGTGPFQTGIAYTTSCCGQTALLSTFSTLSAGDFTVYVLDGNTDHNGVGNTFIGLGVDNGAAVTTSTALFGTNQFTRFDVTGATTSDVFQVYATADTTEHPSLGGLTFSNISPSASPVPEPSSISLGLLGLGTCITMARRRIRA
jgi:hypothetical protein